MDILLGWLIIAVVGVGIWIWRRQSYPDRIARVLAGIAGDSLQNRALGTELIAKVPGLGSRTEVNEVKLELAYLLRLGHEIAIATHFQADPARALDFIARTDRQLWERLYRDGLLTEANVPQVRSKAESRKAEFHAALKNADVSQDRLTALRPAIEIAALRILGPDFKNNVVLLAWVGMTLDMRIEMVKAILKGEPFNVYPEFAAEAEAIVERERRAGMSPDG